jgi:uncharacterized phage protein (TIGR01671 family)
MREILFRGKTKDGDWVEGDLVRIKDGDIVTPYIYYHGEVIKQTVGQFTGLTDKNGTKIFEGDIIADYFGRIYGVVEYGEGHFDGGVYKYTGFFVKTKEKEIFYDGNIFDERNTDYWNSHKVIGNIHDNPELLGE